jgi:hypothetical protein
MCISNSAALVLPQNIIGSCPSGFSGWESQCYINRAGTTAPQNIIGSYPTGFKSWENLCYKLDY